MSRQSCQSRHNTRRSQWASLVLWLPLLVFVFSFVAGDSLHTSTCQQEDGLKWALNAGHAHLGSSSGHHAGADVDCAACAFQDVTFTMLSPILWIVVLLSITLIEARFLPTKITFAPSFHIARGPPALVG